MFNLFNKNKKKQDDIFPLFSKYAEHLVVFMGMQSQGNYSPIAAFEKSDGSMVGYLYIADNHAYQYDVPETLEMMKRELGGRLRRNEIRSYAIMYHSCFEYGGNEHHTPANNEGEFKSITTSLYSGNKENHIPLPYSFDQSGLNFQGFRNFTPEQNQRIFNTQPVQGKNYFEERVKMEGPSYENEAGIKIVTSNTGFIGHTWAGIFGKDNWDKGAREYFAMAAAKAQGGKSNTPSPGVTVFEMEKTDINYIALEKDGNLLSALPRIVTKRKIPSTVKEILEWENVGDLEAIVSASGRDSFMLKFLASDYAINKEKYHSQKNHDLCIAGIGFIIQASDMGTGDYKHKTKDGEEVTFSEGFCSYMPYNDLFQLGCFNIVSVLKGYRKVNFDTIQSEGGYMLTLKLINHPDQEDFFTIDVFVHEQNMKIKPEDLVSGMGIGGVIQMVGYIDS